MRLKFSVLLFHLLTIHFFILGALGNFINTSSLGIKENSVNSNAIQNTSSLYNNNVKTFSDNHNSNDDVISMKQLTIFYEVGVIIYIDIVKVTLRDPGYRYVFNITVGKDSNANVIINNQTCDMTCTRDDYPEQLISINMTLYEELISLDMSLDILYVYVGPCLQPFLNYNCITDESDICICDLNQINDQLCYQTPITITKCSPAVQTSTYAQLHLIDSFTVYSGYSEVEAEAKIAVFYNTATSEYVLTMSCTPEYNNNFTLNGLPCNPTCSLTSAEGSYAVVDMSTTQTCNEILLNTRNQEVFVYVDQCEQFIPHESCLHQWDSSFRCVCESKQHADFTPDECRVAGYFDQCPSPQITLVKFNMFLLNKDSPIITIEVYRRCNGYTYKVSIVPYFQATTEIDGALCSSSSAVCEYNRDQNTKLNLTIYQETSLLFQFLGTMTGCDLFINGCYQDESNCVSGDEGHFCICKYETLSNSLPAFSCRNPKLFKSCNTGGTTSLSTIMTTATTKATTVTTVAPTTPTTTMNTTTKATTVTTVAPTTPTTAMSTTTKATTVTTVAPTSPTRATTTLTTEVPTTSTVTTSTTQETTTTTLTETISTATPIQSTTIPNIPSLANLTDSGVSLNNVTYVLNVTLEYTSNPSILQPTDISDVSTILMNCAQLPDLPSEDASSILRNIDNVLNVDDEHIEASKSQDKFLSILPTLVLNTNSDSVQYLNGENMGFSSNNLQESPIIGLADKGDSFQTLSTGHMTSNNQNSIVLHTGDNGIIPEGAKVYFTIFRSKKFFNAQNNYRNYPSYTNNFMSRPDVTSNPDVSDVLPSKCIRQLQVPNDSPVLSATVLQSDGIRISKLSSYNMTARLNIDAKHILQPLHGKMIVSWWNEEENIWSMDDLCSVAKEAHLITADCPHLTDFALIIDSMINDPVVCDSGLIDTGFVANILSLTCLTVVLVVELSDFFPFLRKQKLMKKLKGPPLQKKEHIQITNHIMLFLFYFFFTIFSNESVSGKACSFIAAVIYSLLLCSIILTIFQALRTVVLFFPSSFQSIIDALMRPFIALTIGFVIPFVLCMILAATTAFFERQDGFCWVRPDLVVYAIIIPISVLLINALICTMLVAWRLFAAGLKFNRIGRAQDTHMKTKLLALFILQFTMGMPWILQYPTLYHSKTTFWHYAFTIVLGSQGTILAILFFYKNHRRWRESVRLSIRDSRVRHATSHTVQTRT